MSDKAYEGWAILELFGHRRLAGEVSEVEIAGQGFVRIDIPEVVRDGNVYPAATQFYGPSAVYALTPSTEATCVLVLARPEPVHRFEVPAALPERTSVTFFPDGRDDDLHGVDF